VLAEIADGLITHRALRTLLRTPRDIPRRGPIPGSALSSSYEPGHADWRQLRLIVVFRAAFGVGSELYYGRPTTLHSRQWSGYVEH
jgi:hypothetical protein